MADSERFVYIAAIGLLIVIILSFISKPIQTTNKITSPSVQITTNSMHSCYLNGIKIDTVRSCEETENFYKSICKIESWDSDSDCSDYNDQETAQTFYELSIICLNYDIYDLDRDNDGIACEALSVN